MTTTTTTMEPLLPTGSEQLKDLARDVLCRSAAMGAGLHPTSQQGIVELLRLINSYYSNLIEGNSTHPVDIERAMHDDYATDPAKRDLQAESLAHIKCQRQVEERLCAEPEADPSSPEFIRWMHRIFYEELPESLKVAKHIDTDEAIQVIGGELRHRDVKVGSHVAPPVDSVAPLLDRFGEFYQRARHHGTAPIIAAAAAHHRLMWIHPFLDGNGRIARLYTDACLQKVPVCGYGLWNVSRGLARDRECYMQALAGADAKRRGDTDGRGNLTNRGLIDFCTFFLETCLDQIDYMDSLLSLDALLERITGYVRLRTEKIISAPTPRHTGLKPEAAKILQEVLLRGEMARGEAAKASGMPRTGRNILAQLLDEGLLVSNTPKGPVRLGYPTHMAGYLFPDLYPATLL